MATRISIIVSKIAHPESTIPRFARFALDAAKIVGVAEMSNNGLTLVRFIDGRGTLQQVYTETSYDTIMDAVEQVDVEFATKLEIAYAQAVG